MHINLAMRRVSGVALVAAAALGMGTVLAVPAAATPATSITASPEQPRYPVSADPFAPTVAHIKVTVAGNTTADNISAVVTSGPDTTANLSCPATVGVNGSVTCTLTNASHSVGVDQITFTDDSVVAPAQPLRTTTSVAFETVTAVPDQNVGTVATPVYLYGTNETATIAVTITGPSSTPALKGVVLPGSPDANTTLSCTQSPVQAASWTCTLPNHGTAGADRVVIFDDDSTTGLSGQADASEAQVALTVNFEQITGTPQLARDGTPSGIIDVVVTGVPNVGAAPRTPALREVVRSGQFTTAGTCATGAPAVNGRYTTTCTVSNGGRTDSAVVQIYDDLDGNSSPGSGEPTTNVSLSFESLTVTDPNAPHAPNTTATFNVAINGAPAGSSPSVDYFLNPGSTDAPAAGPGPVVLCDGAGSAWSCQLTNTKQANGTATDSITVFDDANNNRTLDANEASTTATILFGSSVTATPASADYPVRDANNPGSGTATISASVVAGVSTVPHLRWTVTNGPDADAAHTSQNCAPLNGGTTNWTCTVPNGGTAGLDTVVVYNDLNFAQFGNSETAAQAAFFGGPGVDANHASGADPNAVVKANFEAPQSVTLTPTLATNQHQTAIASGGCMPFTVDVTPGLTFPVQIVATQPLGSTNTASLSTCNVPGGSTVTTASNTVGGSAGSPGLPPIIPPTPGTYANTLVLTSMTGQDQAHPGRVVFGLSSNHVGTVTVHAQTRNATAANNATSPNVSMTVVAGGQTAARSLTPSPTAQNGVVNGSLTYSVLVQDANSTPLNGVAIDYVINAGDPDASTAPVACTTSDQFGKAKCVVKNGGQSGVDHINFFAPQTSGETAPTASDPQATATGTFQAAPPAGSALTFGCPDELVTNANQIVPACTVSTGNGGARAVIFAAHVANAAGAPLANIPVTFTLATAPTGTTATASQVNTNAKGNSLFVVNVPSPVAGAKVAVQAAVGDPANGGLGPQTAVATFQAPQPSAVRVSPASQRVESGGLASFTAKVTDQFGAGVAGHSLSWAVSGRNSESGQVTTAANGAATFSYADRGSSGSDTVSVLDVSAGAPSGAGSNNPATAVVTFGSGGGTGCQVNCGGGGGGGGGKEHPTLSASQSPSGHHQVKITLKVASHPKLVNATVVFYQLSKGGARHKIGTGHTGRKGKVTGTLKAAHGLHLRFQAKVKGRAGVAGGYSNVLKVHVH